METGDVLAARVATQVDFGETSTSPPREAYGFSHPEPGFSWAVEKYSSFLIDVPPGKGGLVLELSLGAFVCPPKLMRQALWVSVNDEELGCDFICEDTVLAFHLPPICNDFALLKVYLHHPDAHSPVSMGLGDDKRVLGVSLRSARIFRLPAPPRVAAKTRIGMRFADTQDRDLAAAQIFEQTSLSPAEMLMHFESLGRNCEFGIVQRQFGCEALGLLRFAGISLENLRKGLADGFAGLTHANRVTLAREPGDGSEWIAKHADYGLDFHTLRRHGEVKEDVLRKEMVRNLKFYRGKFLEVLGSAEKLFVVHNRDESITLPQARALLLQLRQYGANSILFVTTAQPGMNGAVVRWEDGIYQGFIRQFASIDAVHAGTDYFSWLSICANAYVLWREDHGGATAEIVIENAPVQQIAEVVFGLGSAEPPRDAYGLSFAEPLFNWTVGQRSGFSMPVPPGEGDLALELSLCPFISQPQLTQQRLIVTVDGNEVGNTTFYQAAVVAFYLPHINPNRRAINIGLLHPDTVRADLLAGGADQRELGFCLTSARILRVKGTLAMGMKERPPLPFLYDKDGIDFADQMRGISGLLPAEMMMHFESLGRNCELGIVQRRAGCEVMGLLRFAWITLPNLHYGLSTGFAGLEDPNKIKICLEDRDGAEWMAIQWQYDLSFHTHRFVGKDDPEKLKADIVRNLVFYRRKFLEVLTSADKLFVFHCREDTISLPEIRSLLLMLRRYGKNSVLYVSTGPLHVRGSAVRLEDGIYQGFIGEFANVLRVQAEVDVWPWFSLLANAYRLWREDGGGSSG